MTDGVSFDVKTDSGYERIRVSEYGERYEIYHHRLLALLEHNLGEIKGEEVHHKNGIPWFNVLSNISLRDPSDHAAEHGGYHGPDKEYHDEDWLSQEYIGKDKTQSEIADECGVTVQTISNWVNRHNLA